MTNGEKLCIDFPNMRYTVSGHRVITTIGVAASFDLDWWNAEYIEPTPKNDLGVDLISRADVNRLICEYRDDATETGNERDLERAYGANAVGELISELPSVTPQLSSGLEKNSKKLEKDFGELDCISRAEMLKYQQYLHGKMSNEENHKLWEFIKQLPPVTPQEPTEKCKWIKYDYRTMCPKEHIDVDSPYWRIPENRMETLKYCPYCGKEIEVEE